MVAGWSRSDILALSKSSTSSADSSVSEKLLPPSVESSSMGLCGDEVCVEGDRALEATEFDLRLNLSS